MGFSIDVIGDAWEVQSYALLLTDFVDLIGTLMEMCGGGGGGGGGVWGG